MHGKIIDYLCEELDDMERKVGKGAKLSMQELQYVDVLAHAKKNLLKAEEMSGDDEYSMRGYSRRMSYRDGDAYSGEDYVRPDGSYRDGGMSYARGRGAGAKRDSMGRYSRDGEGSVDEHTKEELRKLIEMM